MTRPTSLSLDGDYSHHRYEQGPSETPWSDWECELRAAREKAGTTCLNCVYLATGIIHMTCGGFTTPACGRRAPQDPSGNFPRLPRQNWCGEFEAMK